jgi:LacI family transcriptional regulator
MQIQGSFDLPSGRSCAQSLFARERSSWPTAIFASNDQMAYGVLEVAEQMGVRIPEDVALVGFDDNILSAHMRPPLTTVHQPFYEMGWRAIEALLMRVDPEHRQSLLQSQRERPPELLQPLEMPSSSEHALRLQLPTNLIVRASSGGVIARR